MKKWRFKTKKEFEKKYGLDWRREIHWNIMGGMDHLCGTLLDEKTAQELLNSGSTCVKGGWHVTKENITPCFLWKFVLKKQKKSKITHKFHGIFGFPLLTS